MIQNTTKQRILEVSIDLFAEYGYKEVTMRKIAAELSIKASSLYKHYSSKDEILDRIYNVFESKLREAEINIPEFHTALEYFTKSYEAFKSVMFDPTIIKISRIITKEQMSNSKIREFMIDELITKPVEGTKYILDLMLKNGMIETVDTQIVAEEYCSYIVFLYFEQSILRFQPDIEYINKKMEQHNLYTAKCIEKRK